MTKRIRASLFAIGVLFPLPVILHFYAQNYALVPFKGFLLYCAFLVVVSALVYLFGRLVFQSSYSAILISAIFWVFVFSVKSVGIDNLQVVLSNLLGFHLARTYVIAAIGAFALILFFIAGMLTRKIKAGGYIFTVLLSVIFGVLLLLNIVSVATQLIKGGESAVPDADLQTTLGLTEPSSDSDVYLHDFATSDDTPSPNVYWFHCDTMTNFAAFEKYFGDDQAEFLSALESRGFYVNTDAMLPYKQITCSSVPSLMCPHFYDNYLKDVLSTGDYADDPSVLMSSAALRTARDNNELFYAFEAKGYSTAVLSGYPGIFNLDSDLYLCSNYINLKYNSGLNGVYVFNHSEDEQQDASVNYFEILSEQIYDRSQLEAFLIKFTYPLYFALDQIGYDTIYDLSDNDYYLLQREITDDEIAALGLRTDNRPFDLDVGNEFYYLLENVSSPQFSIIMFNMAHMRYDYDADGNLLDVATSDMHMYGGTHLYSTKTLLAMVDQILAQDPDAVIVLQGDHGPHDGDEDFFDPDNFDAEQAELQASVLSAVRIPEQYQSGDETSILDNTLNISRYLVNSFVGYNYAYIDD